MNDCRLPIWIRSRRDEPHQHESGDGQRHGLSMPCREPRPSRTHPALPGPGERGVGVESVAGSGIIHPNPAVSRVIVSMKARARKTKKRKRIDMELNVTSRPTTEVPVQVPVSLLTANPTETEKPSYASGSLRRDPDSRSLNESLHSLLSTLRLLTTQRQEERERCRRVTRPPHESNSKENCNKAPHQIIMQTLRKVVDRCHTCPWEAIPTKDDRRRTGEPALSIICSLPFRFPVALPSTGEWCSDSPRVKEQLEYATAVADAVSSVLGACPGQVHHEHFSGRSESGDTPLRRFLRNNRLLWLLLLTECQSSRRVHQGAASSGCQNFILFVKAAVGIGKRGGHRKEYLHGSVDAWKSTAFLSDSCGFFPLDHLIRSTLTMFSEMPNTSGEDHGHSISSPLVLLEAFFQTVPSPFENTKEIERFRTCHRAGSHFQPLIKLLTTVFDGASEKATRCLIDMLVRWESTLLFRPSDRSGCLPLHVALGQNSQYLRPDEDCKGTIACHLIQLYDESASFATSASKYSIHGRTGESALRDSSSVPMGAVWTHRNRKGELPLHVACRAGVSTSLLRVVMERTLIESKRFQLPIVNLYEWTGYRFNYWIWSATNLGASPLDILWSQFLDPTLIVNHQSHTHHAARPTSDDDHDSDDDVKHPLSLSHGIMLQCIHQWKPTSFSFNCAHSMPPKALVSYPNSSIVSTAPCSKDLVLERISLVLRATVANLDAHQSSWLPLSQFDTLLHAVSALCVPVDAAPMIPDAILDLALNLTVQQQPVDAARQRDERGRTALHYCFVLRAPCEDRSNMSQALGNSADNRFNRKVHTWEKWIMRLLQYEPTLAQTPDSSGRLSIHYALLFCLGAGPRETNRRISADAEETFASAKARVVEKLTSLVPESILVRDRRTNLYPFLLAATNKDTTLDMTYTLLRRCPNALILLRST